MNRKRQKKIFFKTIGKKDEFLFDKERSLEKEIAKSILTSPINQRDHSYREGYERLHKFLLSLTKGQAIYHGLNLQKALRKQSLFSQIIGKKHRILEVGCGEGLSSIALSKNDNIVTGTDISNTCIAIANRNKAIFSAEKVNFLVMNASKLDFSKNTFDWIVSIDLLEHLHPQDAGLHFSETARVLKPKGRYLLVTPNAFAGMHAGYVHIKEYDFKELIELFSNAGFKVKFPLIYYTWPFAFLVDIKIKILLQKLLRKQVFLYTVMGLDPIILIATKNG